MDSIVVLLTEVRVDLLAGAALPILTFRVLSSDTGLLTTTLSVVLVATVIDVLGAIIAFTVS